MEKNTKQLILAALMAAFTCIATMIIKIPTPTFGYIHLGDSLVLLCGIVFGPFIGGLAAGIGSMLSDIFSGYASWAPATFLIKALTAGIMGFLFRRLKHTLRVSQYDTLLWSGRIMYKISAHGNSICVIIGGLAGETIMVIGYFLYETALAAFASGGFTKAALYAGAVSSATGIPFNIVQGVVGIVIALALLPVLLQISDIRDQILNESKNQSNASL